MGTCDWEDTSAIKDRDSQPKPQQNEGQTSKSHRDTGKNITKLKYSHDRNMAQPKDRDKLFDPTKIISQNPTTNAALYGERQIRLCL